MQAVRKKQLIMMHIKDTINEVISYEYIKQTTAKHEFVRICYECLTNSCGKKKNFEICYITKFCCKSLKFECIKWSKMEALFIWISLSKLVKILKNIQVFNELGDANQVKKLMPLSHMNRFIKIVKMRCDQSTQSISSQLQAVWCTWIYLWSSSCRSSPVYSCSAQ